VSESCFNFIRILTVNMFYHPIKYRVMSVMKCVNSFVVFVYLDCKCKSVSVCFVIGLSFQCAVLLMSRVCPVSSVC
jgi:hypothetical protein